MKGSSAFIGFALVLALVLSAVACGTRLVCDATNCTSGCCDTSGLCFVPANDSCGLKGASCVACAFTETCRGGVCTTASGGGTAGGGDGSEGGGMTSGGGTESGGGVATGGGTAIISDGGNPDAGPRDGGLLDAGAGGGAGGGSANGGGVQTVGGGAVTGGGTATLDSGTPCAILASILTPGISFDYLYPTASVYVGVTGWPKVTCPGFHGQVGYDTATSTPVFTDNGSTGVPVNTGASSSLTFWVGERALNTAEMTDVSRLTGIPVAALSRSVRLLDGLSAVQVNPTPPLGISASWSDPQQAIVFSGPYSSLVSYANSTLAIGAHVYVSMVYSVSTVSDPTFAVDFVVQTDHAPHVTAYSIMER